MAVKAPGARGRALGVASLVLAFGAWAWIWLPSPLITVAERAHPNVIYRGDPSTRIVALTIDDGPDPQTTSVAGSGS